MMSMIRSPALTRLAASRMTSRALSTQTTQAVAKLQAVLESYRLENYTQEIPTRFKKEVVNAAAHQKPVVNATGLQHVLHNIGADHVLSASEIQAIFREMGNEKGEISAQHMVQLL